MATAYRCIRVQVGPDAVSAAPRLLAKPLVQPLGRWPLPKIGAHSRSEGFHATALEQSWHYNRHRKFWFQVVEADRLRALPYGSALCIMRYRYRSCRWLSIERIRPRAITRLANGEAAFLREALHRHTKREWRDPQARTVPKYASRCSTIPRARAPAGRGADRATRPPAATLPAPSAPSAMATRSPWW
jgi:hypothetical protein